MIDWSQQETAAEKQAQADHAARQADKAARQAQVRAIVITTAAGNAFQGDEISQSRMDRTLNGYAGNPPDATLQWILADNTVATISLGELAEALSLAVVAQSEIWINFPLTRKP
jgi:hypothetical protein